VGVELADGQRLLALVGEPAATPLAVGDAVRLELPPDAFMVLR
jgi:hypothetical protein